MLSAILNIVVVGIKIDRCTLFFGSFFMFVFSNLNFGNGRLFSLDIILRKPNISIYNVTTFVLINTIKI